MAQQQQTSSIAAPGFFGLNLQESAVALSSGFCARGLTTVLLIVMVRIGV